MKYLITEKQLRLIEDLELKSRANDQERKREEYVNQILKNKNFKDLNSTGKRLVINLKPEILDKIVTEIFN